jgi:hypothetical protein
MMMKKNPNKVWIHTKNIYFPVQQPLTNCGFQLSAIFQMYPVLPYTVFGFMFLQFLIFVYLGKISGFYKRATYAGAGARAAIVP